MPKNHVKTIKRIKVNDYELKGMAEEKLYNTYFKFTCFILFAFVAIMLLITF